jgi:hypothetical protein
MPFKSLAQRRACWAQYHRDIKAGRKPSWDCHEWEHVTEKGTKLPERIRSPKKKSYTRLSPKKDRKRQIHIGPRGGKYMMVKGRKVYV